jgi:hypothetical protein
LACNSYFFFAEECGQGEGRSAPSLALNTIADNDEVWVIQALDRKLTALAQCRVFHPVFTVWLRKKQTTPPLRVPAMQCSHSKPR